MQLLNGNLVPQCTMLLAHGEDNCRPVATMSRLCQSKFSLVEFLGTSPNRIWFKHSVLLEIFELNGREAKMQFKPYRKVIFISFSNKKSKFETCSQLVLKTSATAEVDLGTIRWFWMFPIFESIYIVDAVTLSGILKAKQKLGVTFNFDKQDIIDLTKISKMTMCRASEANSEK